MASGALAGLLRSRAVRRGFALSLPLLVRCSCYPSTGKVWQTLNIGESSRVPNHQTVSGAVHGQMSGHCGGVVCQTLPVLRYLPTCLVVQSLFPPRGCVQQIFSHLCSSLYISSPVYRRRPSKQRWQAPRRRRRKRCTTLVSGCLLYTSPSPRD